MVKRNLFIMMFILGVFLATGNLFAEENCTKEDVVKAVDEAVAILENEGRAGLEKVGQISFCGDNYVFVNDFDGKTLMHIKPHLIGKVLIGLKDDQGKRFFADFTKVAQGSQAENAGTKYYNGKGWVSYRWPKPGEKAFSPKLSYIKACLMDGENIYIGAGIYE